MQPEQLSLFDAPEPPPPAPAASEPPAWRPAPDAGYPTAQEAARKRGWALDWNGQQYTLWRPPWHYTHSPTLPPLLALIAPAPAPLAGELPADLVDAQMVIGPLPYMITISDGCPVGVTFAFSTLELNIAAAREYLAAQAARLAAEAAQAAAKAQKKAGRKKAS